MHRIPSDNTPDRVPEDPGYTTRADSREARDNAHTISSIPHEQLPWPEVRAALIACALAGFDTYAYRPANSPRWVIWDRQPNPALDARYTPRQWAINHGYDVGEMPAPAAPRFAIGEEVRWPQGHCILRIDGSSIVDGEPPTRFYGGPIVRGAGIGGYVITVPEDQLEAIEPETLPDGPEAA